MAFPTHRLRRTRMTAGLRSMIRETRLAPEDFILPIFVGSEPNLDREIPALPSSRLLSDRPLVAYARQIRDAGIPALLLFGIALPGEKDPTASVASAPDGPVQRAIKTLKDEMPELVLIADLCLCEYSSDAHCGLMRGGQIDNDATLERIGDISVAYARSGADMIAPSGMIDGMVQAIRDALDQDGFVNTATMPYSAKFATALYGPFKAGTHSSPEVGLHHTHQMDIGNGREALREVALDLEEGADIVIVKPATPNLDIIHAVRDNFSVPIAAYQVSGELAMVRAAGATGAINADAVMMESMLGIKRAGADMIISYAALDAIALL